MWARDYDIAGVPFGEYMYSHFIWKNQGKEIPLFGQVRTRVSGFKTTPCKPSLVLHCTTSSRNSLTGQSSSGFGTAAGGAN